MTRHDPVKNQMTHGHRGFQWITNDVVEVVIAQPITLGIAQGVHEHHDAQFIRFCKELL